MSMARRARFLLPVSCLTLCCWAVQVLSQQDDASSSQAERQRDKSGSSARSAEESSSKDTRIDLSPPSDDQKNYHAALERYKEALVYKPNDAVANFRLAECLEKTGNPGEAVAHYQEYLKILPHGPLSPDAQKALERLKAGDPKASAVVAP